jgi:hypothetical protein
MSIYDNKKELLSLLTIEENFLYGDFSNKYSEKIITKKSGGKRIINPPKHKLKVVQRIILDKILKAYHFLPCVYGLTTKKNIIENAKRHQNYSDEFVLLLDIKDFFPSVSKSEVNKCYKKLKFNNENSKILTKLSTHCNRLPQGSPTSCHIASVSLEKLDKEIYRYCNSRKLIFTRYIDDITISGKLITDNDINNFEKMINKYGYKLNNKKVLLSPKDEKVINNLSVSNEKITVTDKYLFELEDLFSKFNNTKDEVSYAKFIGKLGFYMFVNEHEACAFFKEIQTHKANINLAKK